MSAHVDHLDAVRSISLAELRVGQTLDHPIRDAQDVLLLAAGQAVTQSLLDHLDSRGVKELRVHLTDWERIAGGQSSTDNPVPSSPLEATADAANTESQAAAAPTTEVEASTPTPNADAAAPAPNVGAFFVVQPHCTTVNPPPSRETSREANRHTRRLEALLTKPRATYLAPQRTAFQTLLTEHGRVGFEPAAITEFRDHFNESFQELQRVYAGVVGGAGLDCTAIDQVIERSFNDLVRDFDLFAAVALNPAPANFPVRHALHAGMLSLCLGTRLGFDRSTLRELCLGILLHDIGMLRLDRNLVRGEEPTNSRDCQELAHHPVRVFDFLETAENLPLHSLLVIYQLHERNDGTGFPRGKLTNQIHDLSKVAAVADAYIDLVAARMNRAALWPHLAIDQLIRQSNRGELDAKAVVALVETASLYPLGSLVRLSDQRIGMSLRPSRADYERPLVEAWSVIDRQGERTVVDLAADRQMSVVAPLLLGASTQDDDPTGPTNDEARLQRLLDLSELLDGTHEHPLLSRQRSLSKPYRKAMHVFHQRLDEHGGSHGDWRATPVRARALSRQGITVLSPSGDLPQELVIPMIIDQSEPMFLKSHVAKRSALSNDWWVYSLDFENRFPPTDELIVAFRKQLEAAAQAAPPTKSPPLQLSGAG